MKKALVVMLVVFALAGCTTPRAGGEKIFQEPTVIKWAPSKVFLTAGTVKKVDGLDMGRVLLETQDGSDKFSGIVIPMREIPTGTRVEMIYVSYRHHETITKSFYVVRVP